MHQDYCSQGVLPDRIALVRCVCCKFSGLGLVHCHHQTLAAAAVGTASIVFSI